MKTKKGLKLGQSCSISRIQKEVLDLLTKEYMTPPKVANYRHTSLNAVYKTINILEKKGLYNHELKKVEFIGCTPHTENLSETFIRLHGQEFNISFIKKGNNYNKIRENNNTFIIDDNTIRLYENSLEIYSGKSFTSDDVNKATHKSFEYFNRFIKRLENDLDLILLKDRYHNINLVKHHYSLTNNEFAKDLNEQKVKLRIYAKEDGKMWFEIDNSFNLNEAETTHPKSAQQDMQNIIKPFFDDLRNNFKEAPLMSDVLNLMKQQAIQVNEIATGLNVVVRTLQRIIPQEQEQQVPQEDFTKPNYIG